MPDLLSYAIKHKTEADAEWGLKGSDGSAVQARARALGAVPMAGERARMALVELTTGSDNHRAPVLPGCGYQDRPRRFKQLGLQATHRQEGVEAPRTG